MTSDETNERSALCRGLTQQAAGPLQNAGVLATDFLVSPIPPEILSAQEFARGTLAMLERLEPMKYLSAPVGHLYGPLYRRLP